MSPHWLLLRQFSEREGDALDHRVNGLGQIPGLSERVTGLDRAERDRSLFARSCSPARCDRTARLCARWMPSWPGPASRHVSPVKAAASGTVLIHAGLPPR
ncbi:hypothetical protein [Pantoea sp. 1.19]|uniref:hypothetical protein n=1 Tax=Pantoea sp. 1.19 TaxID=1925589 RepID=UPI00111547A7|nr:hypothetical protein [Pantoea sp. 1.19]